MLFPAPFSRFLPSSSFLPSFLPSLSYYGLSLVDAFRTHTMSKALGLDMAKTNISGGAIAMGHPIGASGARIMAHLTHALHRTHSKYAIGAACIGGGQGIAIIIEKC
jgi:acetyl-CoA acetyltransferase